METPPLLVKLPFQKRVIVFTSFHNEAQNSEIELDLLRYLVFATVTARVGTEVTQTMVKGGFSPEKQNILSASAGAPAVTQTYHCRKAGQIQFALAFEDRGARLRLVVKDPNGQKYEKEGISTFVVEVPNAAAGDWQYTVTALKVPYPNFPFQLTIGQK